MSVTIQQGLPVTASGGGLTLSTPQNTTSGSTITFSGLPAGVKQIIMSWVGGSTNGTGAIGIQIGDSGGLETTGYAGSEYNVASAAGSNWSTQATIMATAINAAALSTTVAILTLVNSSTNLWSIFIQTGREGVAGQMFICAGSKALSGTLDRIALLTANTFDAGSVNIAYSS